MSLIIYFYVFIYSPAIYLCDIFGLIIGKGKKPKITAAQTGGERENPTDDVTDASETMDTQLTSYGTVVPTIATSHDTVNNLTMQPADEWQSPDGQNCSTNFESNINIDRNVLDEILAALNRDHALLKSIDIRLKKLEGEIPQN